MTAGSLIAQADALRPNAYSTEQKLCWLRRLDGQILLELLETHSDQPGRPRRPDAEQENEPAAPALPPVYEPDTELLAPFPWGEGLYLAGLFCQIDLHNGEIQRYNQSLSLLASAWRSLADWINRSRRPLGAGSWKM